MLTKKDLLLWIYELEDAINALTDDVEKLNKRIKKLEGKVLSKEVDNET